MSDQNALVSRLPDERLLTRNEFNALADMLPEIEWFPSPVSTPAGCRPQ
jgi:hypothetical protein